MHNPQYSLHKNLSTKNNNNKKNTNYFQISIIQVFQLVYN